MSFWSGFLGGSNPTVNSGIKQAGQVAGYGTSKGQGLTTAAGDFFTSLLSGNPAQTAKVLAPKIQAQQQQAQQAKNTAAQFGNRSGGTNAANQTIDDKTRANIGDMISKLTGEAAGASADLGKNLIDTGMNALSKQVDFSQTQMDNWSNSLFGKAATTATSAAETYAMGGGM